MTSVKIKFRPSKVKDKDGALYYQVIHGRIVKQIKSGCRVHVNEWDGRHGTVIVPDGCDVERAKFLAAVRQELDDGFAKLRRTITVLDSRKEPYSCDKIFESHNADTFSCSFVMFANRLIAKLQASGRTRTAERYATVIRSFMRHVKNDVLLSGIDANLIENYEAALRNTGVSLNTSSFYMRNLRAIYNRAVDEGLTEQRTPFRHVYTGIGKTAKRALTLKDMKRIKNLDLPAGSDIALTRDLFMLSFYLRGMSFIDMAYLRKTDLRNGTLSYRRRKTGQALSIKWEQQMQDILDRWPKNPTIYLLPIITDPDADARRQFATAQRRTNLHLKKIATMLQLGIPLSMYCARHSWGSIARSYNIPISVISEGMGHDSEKTTRIYLASLDTAVVDRANKRVITLL